MLIASCFVLPPCGSQFFLVPVQEGFETVNNTVCVLLSSMAATCSFWFYHKAQGSYIKKHQSYIEAKCFGAHLAISHLHLGRPLCFCEAVINHNYNQNNCDNTILYESTNCHTVYRVTDHYFAEV